MKLAQEEGRNEADEQQPTTSHDRTGRGDSESDGWTSAIGPARATAALPSADGNGDGTRGGKSREAADGAMPLGRVSSLDARRLWRFATTPTRGHLDRGATVRFFFFAALHLLLRWCA